MLRKLKILGMKIDANPEDVRKLAADLSLLQANVYRQTGIEHYLDQDAGEGHANFELNKFGVALQQAIKADLRAMPQKCYLDFYVTLMAVLYGMRNYELAARVYNGINDALMRDHCDIQPGQFEYPAEDKKITKTRELLRKNLESIECYQYFQEMKFPNRDQARNLYQIHVQAGVTFVPMVEILFKFISMYLEGNSLSASDRKHIETDQQKKERLKTLMNDVSAELSRIHTMMTDHLPQDTGYLHFDKLKTLFSESLKLNLHANTESIKVKMRESLGVLDDVDAISALPTRMSKVQLPTISPRGRFEYPRTPRKSIKDGICFGGKQADGLFSTRKLRSSSDVAQRRHSIAEISESSSEEMSPRNK